MNQISKTLLMALDDAYRKYYSLNDSNSFIRWPEYFSTVNCAMRLKEILPSKGYVIELESKTNGIVLGNINSLRVNEFKQYKLQAQMIKDLRNAKRCGKVDIVVKENSMLLMPLIIVENKNFMQVQTRNNSLILRDSVFSSLIADIIRCCTFMQVGKNRKLDYCAITFYTRADFSIRFLSNLFIKESCLNAFKDIDFKLFFKNVHSVLGEENGEVIMEDYANAYVIQLTRRNKSFLSIGWL